MEKWITILVGAHLMIIGLMGIRANGLRSELTRLEAEYEKRLAICEMLKDLPPTLPKGDE